MVLRSQVGIGASGSKSVPSPYRFKALSNTRCCHAPGIIPTRAMTWDGSALKRSSTEWFGRIRGFVSSRISFLRNDFVSLVTMLIHQWNRCIELWSLGSAVSGGANAPIPRVDGEGLERNGVAGFGSLRLDNASTRRWSAIGLPFWAMTYLLQFRDPGFDDS